MDYQYTNEDGSHREVDGSRSTTAEGPRAIFNGEKRSNDKIRNSISVCPPPAPPPASAGGVTVWRSRLPAGPPESSAGWPRGSGTLLRTRGPPRPPEWSVRADRVRSDVPSTCRQVPARHGRSRPTPCAPRSGFPPTPGLGVGTRVPAPRPPSECDARSQCLDDEGAAGHPDPVSRLPPSPPASTRSPLSPAVPTAARPGDSSEAGPPGPRSPRATREPSWRGPRPTGGVFPGLPIPPPPLPPLVAGQLQIQGPLPG